MSERYVIVSRWTGQEVSKTLRTYAEAEELMVRNRWQAQDFIIRQINIDFSHMPNIPGQGDNSPG